ncbi:MAG: hypothetical protein ISR51_05095 [Rhodospirillales bacterium]|nr:hypothetical protein [Alphaproteobacteria bacterium]MBL6948034.1 hypothetical protein [Rhodospirillales bacterium]
MEFHVFQCKTDKDFFVVTDESHLDALNDPNVSPTPGDELEKVGVFGEMGKERAAFDEDFAKRSIESQGFYRFHSKSLDPLGEVPMGIPG